MQKESQTNQRHMSFFSSFLLSVYCPDIELPSGDWKPIILRMPFRLIHSIVEILNSRLPPTSGSS